MKMDEANTVPVLFSFTAEQRVEVGVPHGVETYSPSYLLVGAEQHGAVLALESRTRQYHILALIRPLLDQAGQLYQPWHPVLICGQPPVSPPCCVLNKYTCTCESLATAHLLNVCIRVVVIGVNKIETQPLGHLSPHYRFATACE